MKRTILLLFLVLIAACVPNGPGSPYISTEPAPIAATPSTAPSPFPPAAPLPTTSLAPDEYTFAILGLDQSKARCDRGERCGQGAHTDVFLLVHVLVGPTPAVTAILIPRSLYVPGIGYEMWSMQVYGKTGWEGIHDYVGKVFGIPIDGGFAVDMDAFATIVNNLGGVQVGGQSLDGAETLAYLRDLKNNWGCYYYDCEGRTVQVAIALKDAFFRSLPDTLTDPVALYDLAMSLRGLYTTDLSGMEQITTLAHLALTARDAPVRMVRLWIPEVRTADTPLDIRGLVPATDLKVWMQGVLLGKEQP